MSETAENPAAPEPMTGADPSTDAAATGTGQDAAGTAPADAAADVAGAAKSLKALKGDTAGTKKDSKERPSGSSSRF